MKKIVCNLFRAVPPLIVIGFLWGTLFLHYVQDPFDKEASFISVDVPKGASFSEVTDILEEAGLIRYKMLFSLWGFLRGATEHIKAGEYILGPSMTPEQILNKLTSGETKAYTVLVPEGFTTRQIAQRLSEYGLVDKNRFMELTRSRQLLNSLGIEAKSIEGFLFPDTYRLSRSMNEREMIEFMFRRFQQEITPEIRVRAEEMGFTIPEVVTLASIIEKEAGLREEKPLIAAVFHNRLKRGMKLQSDPTVIYGIQDFDGNITRAHLRRQTPYNTYRIKGLPPGPICNPGLDSIMGALYPAEADYIFFVSKNNGSHQFSSTLTAHNEAVRNYQLERRK